MQVTRCVNEPLLTWVVCAEMIKMLLSGLLWETEMRAMSSPASRLLSMNLSVKEMPHWAMEILCTVWRKWVSLFGQHSSTICALAGRFPSWGQSITPLVMATHRTLTRFITKVTNLISMKSQFQTWVLFWSLMTTIDPSLFSASVEYLVTWVTTQWATALPSMVTLQIPILSASKASYNSTSLRSARLV